MTYTAKIASAPSADLIATASTVGGVVAEPASVTVAPMPTNYVHGFTHFRENYFRDFFTVSGVSGNRVTVEQDTSWHDSKRDGWLDGASVRAYRISGEQLVKVADTTITQIHARRWIRISNDYVPAGTSAYRYRFHTYNRPNFLQWFGVCAMDASGNLGPIAYATASSGDFSTSQPAPPSNTVNTDVETGESSVNGGGPAAPTGVTATAENDGWIINVSWTDTPGAHGHVVFRCDYDPTDLLTDTIDLADASAIQATDILVYEKAFPPLATRDLEREAQSSSRAWGSRDTRSASSELLNFNRERTQTVSVLGDPIEGQFRRYVHDGVLTGNSGRTGAEVYTHSSTMQAWYHVLEAGQEYAVECRAKGSGTLTLTATGGLDPLNFTDAAGNFTLTSDWQTFSLAFTPSSTQTSGPNQPIIAQIDDAGTLDIAWFAMRQTHTPLGEMTAANIARADGVKLVRDHENIKSRPWSHKFSDLVSGDQAPLVRFLRACDAIGASPWFQHEWIWSEDEWAAFAEYVLAPYDPATDTPASKPWAYKRYVGLGWEQPPIDRFEQIVFEIGNENWNTLREFYTMPSVSGENSGTVNGKWLDYVVGLIKSSPHWLPAHATKWRNYLGGWATNIESGWTYDSAHASEEADLIGPADYNGVSWDNNATQTADPEDADAWDYVLANSVLPLNAATDRADKAAKFKALCDSVSTGRAKPLRPAIYEAGPGYMLDGLNGASLNEEQSAAQEYVMKSVGAGTATLDAFLIQAAGGCVLNNFFTFDAGRDWTTHARDVNGGAMNPPWMWVRWLNRTFPAGVAVSAVTDAFVKPIEDFDASSLRDGTSVTGADAVSVFRLDGGGKTGLAVLNRSPVNSFSIAVAVSGVEGRALSLVAMDGVGTTVDVPTGDDLETRREIVIPDGFKAVNNTAASKDNVTLTTTPQTWTDRIEATIPPGLARVWIWE